VNPSAEPRWKIVDFESVPGVPCPCGSAKRAFSELDDYPATIHVTQISEDALTHYHKTLTETYYILECGQDAVMQLDDQLIPLRQGMCIMIPPGVRHRAIGKMKILNIVIPKFDPADEFLD
jgi:mannose-6-phosphate isomerase-like protein (cupin superfamily)